MQKEKTEIKIRIKKSKKDIWKKTVRKKGLHSLISLLIR